MSYNVGTCMKDIALYGAERLTVEATTTPFRVALYAALVASNQIPDSTWVDVALVGAIEGPYLETRLA